jgi:hypothetical protein
MGKQNQFIYIDFDPSFIPQGAGKKCPDCIFLISFNPYKSIIII